MSRRILWIIFLASLTLTLGLKAVQLGWFNPRPPLDLDGIPTLLFFNKSRNANAQMDDWATPLRVVHIDMDRRPDLARDYDIIRAPSLVLLNVDGQVVWRQDEGLSDESPLDLNQAERQIEALTGTSRRFFGIHLLVCANLRDGLSEVRRVSC